MFISECFCFCVQVAFTIKELREMVKLPGSKAEFDAADFQQVKEQLKSML